MTELDKDHIQINIKIRKSLYDDLMARVKKAKTDLANFLLEAFTFGDFLFDEEVKACIAQKSWRSIESMASESKKTSYIS